jgi:glycerol-3-phosphate dehydrogenase
VDDARLVVLNAVDAADRGAEIATRTEFLGARAVGAAGRPSCRRADGGCGYHRQRSRAVGGGRAGPAAGRQRPRGRAAVKGSHIVVPRLYEGDHAYILQGADGRVIFACPMAMS